MGDQTIYARDPYFFQDQVICRLAQSNRMSTQLVFHHLGNEKIM